MSTPLDYALVDVFAERPLEGNMLAIFPDARGLTTDQMQALARETNLAETTFILPAEDESQGVRVRIFTTEEEFDFAGHPTLGTAAWLHLNHATLKGAETITLKLNVGPIPVKFSPELPGPGIYGSMRQNDPVFGATHAPAEVARALGLAVADLDLTYPIQTVSTGMPFCIVPIASQAALGRMAIHQATAQAWLDRAGAKFFYCLTPSASPDADFEARMQFYNGEDPATGSAAGCAISWLVRHGIVPGGQPVTIAQGRAIRRPSRIDVRASRAADGKIFDVFVSGRTIPVARGQFFLP